MGVCGMVVELRFGDQRLRTSFRDLVDRPDLLSLLARRLRLTVYLGDSYRESPEATRSHLTELATELALRDAAEAEEWRSARASGEEDSEFEGSALYPDDDYAYDDYDDDLE